MKRNAGGTLARVYICACSRCDLVEANEPAWWPITVCVPACSTFCVASLLFPFCRIRLLAKTWLLLWYRLYDIVSPRTYHQHILISEVVANAFVSIFASVYLFAMIHPSTCTYMYSLYIYHVQNMRYSYLQLLGMISLSTAC
jgi:hypothetical protein